MTRHSKYRAVKCRIDGIVFASKAEGRRYCELKLLQRTGKISDLTLQPSFTLQEKFTDNEGEKHRAIRYVGDFSYIENGKQIIEDVKGAETKEFLIKAKMFRRLFPQFILRITK